MRQADFVHLHLHSAYSLLQSTIRLPQLVERARQYRLPALAITDHGNLFGCIEFYDLAYNKGIKPIIGCELTVDPIDETESEQEGSTDSANHLVLLARNLKGYQNLLKLVTAAHSQGWQQRPRITTSQLYDHHQGLIILSGCQRGEIPTRILQDDHQRAKVRAAEYLEVFGSESFFIELQPPVTEADRTLNDSLLSLARQLDLQVVATANCHALDVGDSDLVRILAAIRLGIPVKEIPPPAEHGFRSPEEMKAEFAHLPEAIASTIAIAERCNLDLDLGRFHLPKLPLEKGQEAMTVLRQQAEEGLRQRLSSNRTEAKSDYSQRLDYELKTIERLGLADYFLVIADFVDFARARGVPVGPGSGAAGSSLTAYAVGITKIDPLQNDLLFERLINPLNLEFPDIDLGFGMEMREEVHQYLRSKYGEAQVAQIVSFVTMQPRTAVRDLGKVLDLSPADLEDEVEGGEAPPAGEGKRRVLELAAALEGLPRQVSTHATGIVIGDGPLVQRVPLYRGHKGGWVSQYNVRALKRAGLVKFDLIARKALTVFRKALELIGDESDLSAAIKDLPLDDEAAFALLSEGKVGGIPYLEGARAKSLLLKLQPRDWQGLLVLLALIRPVALESRLTERFLRARQDQSPAQSLPVTTVENETGGTGLLLFDVDLNKYIVRATGWSPARADELCRLLMKGEEEEAENIRSAFIEQVEGKGSKRGAAESIWAMLESSAGVVANKSTTVAQALTVLQAAFLKARFPEHYMAALLSSEYRQHDLLAAHVEVCRQEDLRLLPPDINASGVEFTVEREGIRVGLAAIRHITRTTAEAIVLARVENGPFNSVIELCTGVESEYLGKRGLEALVKAGALDSFHCGRLPLHQMVPAVIEQARRGQMALFDSCDLDFQSPPSASAQTEWDESAKLAHEKAVLGFYLSGHPLSEYRSLMEKLTPGGAARLRNLPVDSRGRLGGIVEEIKVIRSRKNEPLHFLQVEDFSGSTEVTVFDDVFGKYESCIYAGALVLVSGRVAKEGGRVKLVADDIVSLEAAAVNLATSLHCHFTVEGLSKEALRELQQLLKSQPGSCPVFLHVSIGGQTEVVHKLPTTWAVRPTRRLITEITGRFGESCLEVHYSEGEAAQI